MRTIDRLRLWGGGLFPHTHGVLSRCFPHALWGGNPARNEIALTFDDGPWPDDTLGLLDVLAKHQVVATFFWLGVHIQTHQPLVRAVLQAGHQIAIHGYEHRAFPTIPAGQLHKQLDRVRFMLADASGHDPSSFCDVRPPFGLFTPATLHALIRWGYRPVMWSIVPLHWLQPSEQTLQQVVGKAGAGSLIVLHERQQRGPQVATLADSIIASLTSAKLRFVSVEQFWRARQC